MSSIVARLARPSLGRPSVRWTVPLGIAALVVGGSVLGPALASAAGVDLPERTAEQLLTDLQGSDVTALSGTVLVDARLGLPSLSVPGMSGGPGGAGSGTDLLSVLSGTTTLGVWASGEKVRLAVHGDGGERGIISDGTQLWTWSSDDLSVTRTPLPQHPEAAGGTHEPALDPAQMLTPEALSAKLIEKVSPTTTVTTGANLLVAGRPSYQLMLTPAEPGSLVAQVRIAIDAAERVPTRVEIMSTSSTSPALSVGFTSVSFSAPADGVFEFTPPAGATLTEKPLGPDGSLGEGLLGDASGPYGTAPSLPAPSGDAGPSADTPVPTVVGTGWASVLVLSGVDLDSLGAGSAGGQDPGAEPPAAAELGSVLALVPEVSGSWGSGRLLTSALVSVLLTDDGHLLVGSVDGATLQRVAATLG